MAHPAMKLGLVSTNLVYISNEGGSSSGLGGRVCLDGAGSSKVKSSVNQWGLWEGLLGCPVGS